MNEIAYFFYSIGTYPDIIKVCISSILITVSSAIVLLFTLYRMRNRDKFEMSLREKHESYIVDYFDYITTSERPILGSQIVQDFSARFKINNKIKDLIVEILVDRFRDIPANHVHKLNVLIKAVQIDKRIEKRLDFSFGRSKYRLIEQISNLKLESVEAKIMPFAYSKNKNIKSIARAAYTELNKSNPYKFFGESTNDFNKWDELNLYKSLEASKDKGLPNFSVLINYSENEAFTVFLLKMVSHFKQVESIDAVIPQLQSRSQKIIEAAVLVLGELEHKKSETVLMNMFKNQGTEVQIAIIKSVAKYGSEKGLKFLEENYNKATDLSIKKVIAHEIFGYNKQGRELFYEIKKTKQNFEKLILEHIENPLIHFKYA
jgi:hypothetical protein